MTNRFLALSLLAALLGTSSIGTAGASVCGSLCAPSQAANEASFNISIWNPLTADYPVTGTIDVTYHANGNVTGYYHPAGLSSRIPITGGRQGDEIWLTIGFEGSWQLIGNFHDGIITGAANNGTTRPYSFKATPV